MRIQDNHSSKTLGSRSAYLVAELNERNRQTFTLEDVRMITGLPPVSARTLVHKAVERGVMCRLKRGLYRLVPSELGHRDKDFSDPYAVAADLMGDQPYFLSFHTAFELHHMTTRPNVEISVSCLRQIRPQIVGNHPYVFHKIKPGNLFGVTDFSESGKAAVPVSDLERTVIDALHFPGNVGGITDAANGLWMRHEAVCVEKLIGYAQKLGVVAVMARLGYLLELYKMASDEDLASLRRGLTATYHRLDPGLKADGRFLSRWRLRLNVSTEELDAVRWS